MDTLYVPKHVDLFGGSALDLAAALASYSGDRIADAGAIRKPFVMDGCEWVCVSVGYGGRGCDEKCTSIEAYRLSTLSEFGAEASTYRKQSERADEAQNNPLGFYHGITVKSGTRTLVLTGPCFELLAEPVAIAERGIDREDDDIEDLEDDQEAAHGFEDDGRTRIGNTPDLDDDDDDDEMPMCFCNKPIDKTDNYYVTDCGYQCDHCALDHARACAKCAAGAGWDAALLAGDEELAVDAELVAVELLAMPPIAMQLDMFGGAA